MTDSIRVVELLERLARLLANDSHSTALKPVQWEALNYLASANRFSRTPGALTAFLNLTKGTVSQTLMALEQKGLLKKRSAQHDRRSVQLELTRAGKKLLVGANPRRHMDAAVRRLPNASSDGLERSLEHLLQLRIAINGGRAFGQCVDCRHFRHNDPDGKPHRCALLDAPLSKFESEQICVEQESAA